jgi:hypothetical protein
MRNLLTPAKQGGAGEKAKEGKLEEAPQYGTLRPGWLAGSLADWAGWRKKVRMQPGAAAEVAQRSAAMLKQACEDCDVLWCAVL